MTFADRLEELRKAATQGEWCGRLMLEITVNDSELCDFLVNNADAILELVRAAEYVMEDEITGVPRADSRTRRVVANALA